MSLVSVVWIDGKLSQGKMVYLVEEIWESVERSSFKEIVRERRETERGKGLRIGWKKYRKQSKFGNRELVERR